MELQTLIGIVAEASRFMVEDSFEISQKGGYANIVTSSDLAVQNFLCEKLSEALPGCGFICEEEDIREAKKEYTFIIDPIDGTANYSRGIAQCCICVGLKHWDEMEMSVVYLPWAKELFYARKGRGAYLNGKPIHVSDRPFANCVLSTALPVYHKEFTDVCSHIIADAFRQINDIRRFGAAAQELCYLAMGRVELFFEYLISPWDYAAASLILTEAGGMLTGLQGNTLSCTEPTGVVAGNNSANHKALLEIVQKHLSNQ